MSQLPFTSADSCWCQPFDAQVNPRCPMHGSPANQPPIAPIFTHHGPSVLERGKVIGRMISKTLAKRVANALNSYTPNREGA